MRVTRTSRYAIRAVVELARQGGERGTALAWNLEALTGMIVRSALHQLVLGPRGSAVADRGAGSGISREQARCPGPSCGPPPES